MVLSASARAGPLEELPQRVLLGRQLPRKLFQVVLKGPPGRARNAMAPLAHIVGGTPASGRGDAGQVDALRLLREGVEACPIRCRETDVNGESYGRVRIAGLPVRGDRSRRRPIVAPPDT